MWSLLYAVTYTVLDYRRLHKNTHPVPVPVMTFFFSMSPGVASCGGGVIISNPGDEKQLAGVTKGV